MNFFFEGKPILDVRKFCRERGCKLLKVRFRTYEVNPHNGQKLLVLDETVETPALFIESLRVQSGGLSWQTHELLGEIPL